MARVSWAEAALARMDVVAGSRRESATDDQAFRELLAALAGAMFVIGLCMVVWAWRGGWG